ncbi:MAG: hypothetical protein WBP45_09090 [Daejeonella sp.]
MPLTYTQHTFEKLEYLFKCLGYKIRYERGTFKTGACKFDDRMVIVVNKFSNLESKITALAEIIQNLESESGLLDEKQNTFLHTLKQTKLKI